MYLSFLLFATVLPFFTTINGSGTLVLSAAMAVVVREDFMRESNIQTSSTYISLQKGKKIEARSTRLTQPKLPPEPPLIVDMILYTTRQDLCFRPDCTQIGSRKRPCDHSQSRLAAFALSPKGI